MTEGPDALYPLQFEPVFKDYPWGGRAIGTKLGRLIPPGLIAESWELSAHPDGPTLISNGVFAGHELSWLQREFADALVGRFNARAIERDTFPLLIKILDAHDWLSVQVHPDDEYAMEHGGDLGKTEMWVVLDADPGAQIMLGFQKGVDSQTLRQAIASGTVADCVHRAAARPGDVFFVPPGTIHAIGPGVLLAEIQQSSNVTYRLFDWNRTPERTLHIEQSLEILNFEATEVGSAAPSRLQQPGAELLAACPYFRTERITLAAGEEIGGCLGGDSYEIWGSIAGSVTVAGAGEQIDLRAVSWTLLPAALGEFTVLANEASTVLRVLTPDPA